MNVVKDLPYVQFQPNSMKSGFFPFGVSPIFLRTMRVGMLIMLVTAFTLVLVSFLNDSNYRKNYAELTRSRYLVLANNLKQTIEVSLNLGLRLGQLEPVLDRLDEIKSREPNVLLVQVFTDQGQTVLSTDRTLIGKSVNPEWLLQLDRVKKDGNWQGASDTGYQVAIPIINNFNAKVGAVLIEYSKGQFDNHVYTMRQKIAADTLLVLTAIFILLILACIVLTIRKRSTIFEHKKYILNDNALPHTSLVPELEREVAEFEATVNLVLAEIAAAHPTASSTSPIKKITA